MVLGFLGRRRQSGLGMGGMNLGFRILGRQRNEGLGLGGHGFRVFRKTKGKKIQVWVA